MPATAQIPVLEAIVEKQRIAAKLLDGVATTFHAVFVHEHDDILEVGSEHVRLVTGHFGIEQQRLAVGYKTRRRLVTAQQEAVDGAGLERYPRERIATLRPASRSSRANFSTTGVLPVPPTVRLPMAMTWTPRVESRRMRTL